MEKKIAIEREDTLPVLPHHVIYNILARLPLKNLMQLKCVCKEWFYTIHDPSLANEFLMYQPEVCRGITVLISFLGHEDSKNLYFSLDLETGFATPLEHLNQSEFANAKVMETLAGLTCFEHDGANYFCNLSTREITALPATGPEFSLNSRIQSFSSLGFDPIRKQYKILKTWRTLTADASGEIKSSHNILTLGTNVWRKIDDSLLDYPLGGCVSLNGCLHYLTMDLFCQRIVVAFHVGNEKFRVIPLPDGASCTGYQTKFTIFKEHLAVVDFEHLEDENLITMYILEDYHNQVWEVKKMFLPPRWKDAREGYENFYVSIISTGEILLTPKLIIRQFYILCYDAEKNSMKKLEVHGLPHNLSPQIVHCPPIEYLENIFSLKKVNY